MKKDRKRKFFRGKFFSVLSVISIGMTIAGPNLASASFGTGCQSFDSSSALTTTYGGGPIIIDPREGCTDPKPPTPPTPTPSPTVYDQFHQVDLENDLLEEVPLSELPEGTNFVTFDSIEEFKTAISQTEIDAIQLADQFETGPAQTGPLTFDDQPTYDPTGVVDPDATTYNGAQTVKWAPFSWDPVRTQILPFSMWIDFSFTYTGKGSSRKFVSMKKMVADSSNFPSSWHTTILDKNYYDNNHGVKFILKGYHLLGVSIKGQQVGLKWQATYTPSWHF